jgi:circadian clock protein KaiB
MPRKKIQDATRRYERYLLESGNHVYVLRLYVTGATPASARAIANLKELCERRLKGRFQLEVIDIFQKPALAEGEQIIAAPTLVKVLPPPLRRFIGDLSDLEGKLLGLDLRPKGDLPKAPPTETGT